MEFPSPFFCTSLNEIDGASLYWYAEKKEGCPYEKETVALPEPASADRLCRRSIHDANAKKTQNANGKCTAYSELERKILRFSGERANQAGNLPNVEPDKGWSMGANRHARGVDAREKQGKLRTFRRE